MTRKETHWADIIDRINPVKKDDEPRREGRVLLEREYSKQHQSAVWTKTYQRKQDNNKAESSLYDLSVFSEWESTLVQRAYSDGVESSFRLLENNFQASKIHTGTTPLNERTARSSTMRTFDAGPDLYLWMLMRPQQDGRLLPHPFVQQSCYLHLVRGILRALDDFHAKGFIHCDLHFGNITLPVSYKPIKTKRLAGEQLRVEALWDDMKIFDFDCSASQKIEPYATLPLRTEDDNGGPSLLMSSHLRNRLLAMHQLLRAKGQIEPFDRDFWSRQPGKPLKCFTTLDWREDLYQLGYWLKEMRDGNSRTNTWGGAAHVDAMSGPAAVNAFIGRFPEELMAWGSLAQMDWCPDTNTSKILAPTQPHGSYIERIDKLLKLLPKPPSAYVIHRADHDSRYKTLLEKKRVRAKARRARWAALLLWPGAQVKKIAKTFKTSVLALWSWFSLAMLARLGLVIAVILGLKWAHDYGYANMAKRVVAEVDKWKPQTPTVPVTPQPEPPAAPPVTPPVAPPVAPPVSPEPSSTTLAVYAAQTKAIQDGQWYASKAQAGPVELQWVEDSLALAKRPGLPEAQFAVAMLHCSGIAAQVEKNTASCGQWLSATLSNPLLKAGAERDSYRDSVAALIDHMVLTARGRGEAADTTFAAALLPGLQVSLGTFPGLAPRLALIQACHSNPKDPQAAIKTLRAVALPKAMVYQPDVHPLLELLESAKGIDCT